MANNRAIFNEFLQLGKVMSTDYPVCNFVSDWIAVSSYRSATISLDIIGHARTKKAAIDYVLGIIIDDLKIKEGAAQAPKLTVEKTPLGGFILSFIVDGTTHYQYSSYETLAHDINSHC